MQPTNNNFLLSDVTVCLLQGPHRATEIVEPLS